LKIAEDFNTAHNKPTPKELAAAQVKMK